MWSENFFNSGVWIIPLVMIILCFLLFKLKVFGRGGFRPPWQDSSESSAENREPETALRYWRRDTPKAKS